MTVRTEYKFSARSAVHTNYVHSRRAVLNECDVTAEVLDPAVCLLLERAKLMTVRTNYL